MMLGGILPLGIFGSLEDQTAQALAADLKDERSLARQVQAGVWRRKNGNGDPI